MVVSVVGETKTDHDCRSVCLPHSISPTNCDFRPVLKAVNVASTASKTKCDMDREQLAAAAANFPAQLPRMQASAADGYALPPIPP